jgi:protein-tyrosine phosphatase
MNDQTPVDPEEARRQAMRAATRRIDRVNEWLHVGGAIPPQEYERFSAAGITHVVDLREASEADADLLLLEQLSIARLSVPVPNFGAPNREQLDEIAEWRDAPDTDSVVYVHCGGGFGRAATMAVGLLLLEGLPLDRAIDQVRSVRPEIRINEDQLAWLRSVEADLKRAQGGSGGTG